MACLGTLPRRGGHPGGRTACGVPLVAFALLLSTAACARVEPVQQAEVLTQWGGDLFGASASLATDADVEGDAMLAGGEVRFTGSTGGDYLGAGGQHEVAGEVGGNLRVAAGDVRVDAVVGRNATLAGGSVRLGEATELGGNGYLAGGRVEMAGTVEGNLRVTGGDIFIDGVVDGELSVEAGNLRVGPGAEIAGDLRHRLQPDRVSVAPDAEIEGEVVELSPRVEAVPVGWWWGLRLLWAVGFLFTGAILVAVFPGTALRSSHALEGRPGASAGLGVLGLVGIPALVGIAFATVVGIPLGLMLLAAFLVLLYVARVIPAVWIGRRILRDPDPGRARTVGAFLLGGLALLLVGLIPVLGPLVALVAILLGVGALLVGANRRRDAPPSEAEAG